ncbi:MAG: adenylosuccinate lyase, partial [Clostridia bacterium]|nr:adenylosuccinate lyase [Clostridia bacterium]
MTRDITISDAELGVLDSASYLALCPLDGRYVTIAKKLAAYFSEYALVGNRVNVEVQWLCFVIEHLNDPNGSLKKYHNHDSLIKIKDIFCNFDKASFDRVKEIESKTNHDVKAVEYFVDEKLDELGMSELKSFVHIGCTSEDITNPSYAAMISGALEDVWIPAAEAFVKLLSDMAYANRETPMLAHTHGQPATPTSIGKEQFVGISRLWECINDLQDINAMAKFNGATGNYSAISIAYPDEDWPALARNFVEDYLDLEFNPVTTQIEPHDYICKIADCIRHFNNILVDFDLDMWLYISMNYFNQIPVKDEVGSSTMPHKVNP